MQPPLMERPYGTDDVTICLPNFHADGSDGVQKGLRRAVNLYSLAIKNEQTELSTLGMRCLEDILWRGEMESRRI